MVIQYIFLNSFEMLVISSTGSYTSQVYSAKKQQKTAYLLLHLCKEYVN